MGLIENLSNVIIQGRSNIDLISLGKNIEHPHCNTIETLRQNDKACFSDRKSAHQFFGTIINLIGMISITTEQYTDQILAKAPIGRIIELAFRSHTYGIN